MKEINEVPKCLVKAVELLDVTWPGWQQKVKHLKDSTHVNLGQLIVETAYRANSGRGTTVISNYNDWSNARYTLNAKWSKLYPYPQSNGYMPEYVEDSLRWANLSWRRYLDAYFAGRLNDRNERTPVDRSYPVSYLKANGVLVEVPADEAADYKYVLDLFEVKYTVLKEA